MPEFSISSWRNKPLELTGLWLDTLYVTVRILCYGHTYPVISGVGRFGEGDGWGG